MKTLFTVTVALGLVLASASSFAHNHMKGKHMGKHMEEEFKKADTNSDGKLSKEEWTAKHNAKFADMDSNSDGMITLEEQQAMRDEMKKAKKK